MAVRGESPDACPHRLVRREDLLPGVTELGGSSLGAENFERPGDVGFHIDPTGFELVFPLKQATQPPGGIRGAGGEEAGERGLEVEVEKDAADVEEEGHG